MPPGSEQAFNDAATTGWETWLVLTVVVGGFLIMAMWIRQLWQDHRELNAWVRNEHADVLDGLTIAFGVFTASRPCLHDSDRILKAATDIAAENPDALDAVTRKALERRQRREQRREEADDD